MFTKSMVTASLIALTKHKCCKSLGVELYKNVQVLLTKTSRLLLANDFD